MMKVKLQFTKFREGIMHVTNKLAVQQQKLDNALAALFLGKA